MRRSLATGTLRSRLGLGTPDKHGLLDQQARTPVLAPTGGARDDMLLVCSLQIQRQEFLQDLFIAEVGVPAVGGKNGLVEALVGEVEPGGAGVI